jgi:malonyl-CoA/methylmalonyl-CoA synthetase
VSGPDQRALEAWRRHLGREPEPQALIAELSSGSLPEAFHATALAGPDRPALEIGGVKRTHRELDEAAGRYGAYLRELGVRRADVVLFSAPSSVAMIEAYLGILRAGATVLLANPAYTKAELRHLVEHSGAVAAVAAEPAFGTLCELADDLPAFKLVLDVTALEHPGPDPLPVEPTGSDEVAFLAYTSGTTGRPKAVPLTHANALSSMRAVMAAWRWSADDVMVHSLPLFHQHGLGGITATLLAGSRAVIGVRFDPDAVCETIEREHGTVLLAVPAMYERFVGCDAFRAERLHSLRLLVSGSAPLSPAMAARVEELVGQIPLERYGTTESGLDVSNLYDGPRKPGSVGLPFPGIEMSVVDGDARPVPDGEDGEIVVRGPQVFAGYRGDEEATAESFYPDGWFRTGDIGQIDPDDGFLSITGRAKELIITGGLNVYPREIELALEQSSDVVRAAVVGVPSQRWGEEVVAAVVRAPGADLDEERLIAFAGERLAPYKRPKRVVFMAELPLNHMGKVVRAELVRLVSE